MKKHLISISLFFLPLFVFSQQNNYLDFDDEDDYLVTSDSKNLMSGATAITMSSKLYPKNAEADWSTFAGIDDHRNNQTFDFHLTQLSAILKWQGIVLKMGGISILLIIV